jgi:hypothetical protein
MMSCVRCFGRSSCRLALCLCVMFAAGRATALAQDVTFPADGTITKSSPIFWLRDTTRTPIILLPAGTPVQVLGQEGPWYRIAFKDARLGDWQTAYVSPFDVKLENASESMPATEVRTFSQRGFIEARGFGFPQVVSTDTSQAFGDALVRDEVFVKPGKALQLAGGLDLRANSHNQVEDTWRLDFDDRSVLRPMAEVRRLEASITTSHVTLDLGKQFIRWGRADILSPTDRFAPRDYLNVIDSEFLPVLGAHASVQVAGETFEAVWLPRMTPSRLPLLTQRWTVVPPEAAGFRLQDNGSIFPKGSEQGARWSHTGRFEMGLSYFNGFNHLPDINAVVDPSRGVINLTRTYADLRTYGVELSIPTTVITLKSEAAYFTSPSSTSEEYVLYVIEAERQVGEWVFDGGYIGEAVTKTRAGFPFGAERGMAKSIIGRASYTVDPRRSVAIEAAARQDAGGFYTRGEFSEAFGQHWRVTLSGVGIAGKDDDFLGQYEHNSHGAITVRLSF